MSPLWTDLFPARIALRPGQAALVRSGATQRAAAPSEDWAGALTALESLLESGGRFQVRLSHHFIRLFLLPAPAAWLRPAEMTPWLQAQLAPVLGEEETWRHAWQTTRPGRPILVAALPEARLAQLQTALKQRGGRLVSLTPWLDAARQRARRRLNRASGWFALAEPGQLLLLGLRDGRPATLRQRLLDSSRPLDAELADLIARESLLTGLPADAPVWLEQIGALSENETSRHTLLAASRDPLLGLL